MGLFQVLAYGYILLLVGCIGILLLRQLRRIILPPYIEQLLAVWGPLLFWGMVSGGLVVLLGTLLRRQTIKHEYEYEGFQDEPQTSSSIYADLTKRVQLAIDRIQDDIDVLSDLGDQTCSLVNEVEEAYAGSKAGDVPESEYSLPTDVQAERRSKRIKRAHVQFKRQRLVYHNVRSTLPVLECFQNSNADETELQTAAAELQMLLENEQVIASIQSTDQIDIALQFTSDYLDKIPEEDTPSEGFQSSAQAPTQAPVKLNVGTLRGQDLISETIRLLNAEDKVHTLVEELRQKTKSARERVDAQYSRAVRLERGDIQLEDVKNGLSASP